MTTLTALSDVRSQRALRLKAHLDPLASGSAWPLAPWLRQAGHSIDAVYVEPDVVPWDRARQPPSADEELRGAIAPGADDRARVSLARVWRGFRRAVILGRPGEGKTALLQRACRRVAISSLAQWHVRTRSLDELEIPIWLRAENIIRAGSVTKALGIDAADLTKSVPMALTVEERRRALLSPSTWLFIDALDERPDGGSADSAVQALATLGQQIVRARIVLSVRTYAWRETDLPFSTQTAPSIREIQAPPRSPVDEGALRSAAFETLFEPEAGSSLAVYELAPLTQSQRANMLARWCSGHDHRDRREQLTSLLDQAPIRELTSNALLLTLLCAAATAHPSRRISRETRRVELYTWLVTDLVTRADKVPLDPNSAAAQDRLLALARAAWALWLLNPGGPFQYQDWVDQLRLACDARSLPADVYQEIRAEVERSGLLVIDGAMRRFFPQTAYEYLSAAGLVQDAGIAEDALAEIARTLVEHAEDTSWREVSSLAIGFLALIRRRPDLSGQVIAIALRLSRDLPAAGCLAGLLGESVVEAGDRDPRVVRLLESARRQTIAFDDRFGTSVVLAQPARGKLADALVSAMRDDTRVPAPLRAQAGTALSWFGDPRFEPEAFWLPAVTKADPWRGFVWIPPGRFVMRNGPEIKNYDNSVVFREPRHDALIERPFLMARWPVTVAQFVAYLVATDRLSWYVRYSDVKGSPSAPLAFVDFADAEGYCDWLTAELANQSGLIGKLGQAIAERLGVARVVARLPMQREWEYVARGGSDGRAYPWNGPFDPNKANMSATRIFKRSTVGCFPSGASRWGVEELCGNVSEWVTVERSARRKLSDGETALEMAGYLEPLPKMVGRLGACCDEDARKFFRREIATEGSLDGRIGFRVVICAGRG